MEVMPHLFRTPVAADKAEMLHKLEDESARLMKKASVEREAINDRRSVEKTLLETAFKAVKVLSDAGWPAFDEIVWDKEELRLIWETQTEKTSSIRLPVALLQTGFVGVELLVAGEVYAFVDPKKLHDFASKHLESLLASLKRV